MPALSIEAAAELCLESVDKVLKLDGSNLTDLVRCVKGGGAVCQVGAVGGNSNSDVVHAALPEGGKYGVFRGEQGDLYKLPLEGLVEACKVQACEM